MKMLTNMDIPEFVRLKQSGILIEVLAYEDILYGEVSSDSYDAIVVYLGDKNAEGILTPRSFTAEGHTLPILGVIDDLDISDDVRSFEAAQAMFLDHGGMYLLKRSSSPTLFKACLSQAAVFGGRKLTQRLPVRICKDDLTELRVDLRSHRVLVNNAFVHLTVHEYLILELLAIRANVVVTKEAILGHLYNGIDVPEIKIVDVFVCKLRKKLGDAGVFVETVWGRGYTLISHISKKEAAA